MMTCVFFCHLPISHLFSLFFQMLNQTKRLINMEEVVTQVGEDEYKKYNMVVFMFLVCAVLLLLMCNNVSG